MMMALLIPQNTDKEAITTPNNSEITIKSNIGSGII